MTQTADQYFEHSCSDCQFFSRFVWYQIEGMCFEPSMELEMVRSIDGIGCPVFKEPDPTPSPAQPNERINTV